MGARGPLPKPDAQGRRVRGSQVVELTTIRGGLTVARPDCPEDYLDETRAAWNYFWKSDLPEALVDIDVIKVKEYFQLYDRYLNVMAVAEKTPFTEGSTGQMTSHPAFAQAMTLLEAMNKLDAVLGIGLANRRRLGIGTSARSATADDINRMPGSRQTPKKKTRAAKIFEGEWEAVD